MLELLGGTDGSAPAGALALRFGLCTGLRLEVGLLLVALVLEDLDVVHTRHQSQANCLSEMRRGGTPDGARKCFHRCRTVWL